MNEGPDTTTDVEHLLRTEAPQVLGALVRRFGRFDIAEDAVQEALLTASRTWPAEGVPENPRSWLIRIGYRRMVDLLRSEQARRRREQQVGMTEMAMREPARYGVLCSKPTTASPCCCSAATPS
ncbi:sigma factor [Streptomyces sp. M10(2022)]